MGAWPFLCSFCWKTPMPIKFLLLGGGSWVFVRGGGWKCQFYFYGRGNFSEYWTTANSISRGLEPSLIGLPPRGGGEGCLAAGAFLEIGLCRPVLLFSRDRKQLLGNPEKAESPFARTSLVLLKPPPKTPICGTPISSPSENPGRRGLHG